MKRNIYYEGKTVTVRIRQANRRFGKTVSAKAVRRLLCCPQTGFRGILPALLLIALLTGATGRLQAAIEKPIISRPPNGGTYAGNADARLSVGAYSFDDGYLTYQWYRSQGFATPFADPNGADKVAARNGKTLLPGATHATIITKTPNGAGKQYYYYWVEITNNLNNETETIESDVVEVTVVDRTLPDKLENGTFTDFLPFDARKPYTSHSAQMPAYWETTAAKETEWAGKYIQVINQEFGYMIRPPGSNCAELSGEDYSSLYQEIATVPGKIYEWSLHHANFADNSEDIMAVIIGPAINEETDYSVQNRWHQDTKAIHSSGIGREVGPYLYPYGKHFNSSYFYDITMALVQQEKLGSIDALAGKSGQTFTVDYNRRTYYIYICSSLDTCNFFSGCYSVPVGNGTTVFGFAGIQSSSETVGNVIADIRFASGSSPASAPEITFENDVSISVPAKTGYVYGLVEVRGSSLILITGARALFDPDGSGTKPEVPISVDATLGDGTGWYASDTAGAPFVSDGVVAFRNLIPGKTYRLVGIPRLAVSPGLKTNLNPTSVYDENYFTDVRTDYAYKGDSAHVWNIDVEEYMDNLTARARITLKHARSDVEYALLPDDGTGHPLTTFTGTAPAYTVWMPGTADFAVFDNLQLNTYYFLVARPYGYSEITHAVAAAAMEADGVTPMYVKIKTPGTVHDVEANNVVRTGCTSIEIARSQTNCQYAVVDPVDGLIVGTQTGNGSTLAFTVPDGGKTFQIIVRNTQQGVNWLKGVRTYGCPDAFAIDYFRETVNSPGTPEGNIPVNVEYRISGKDAAQTWIVRDWTTGIGTQPVLLGAMTLAGNTRSILDSLRTLHADATLAYRFQPGSDGYVGASVSSVQEIVIPRRPDAPEAPVHYTFNYAGEHVGVVADSLRFAPVYTSQWATVTAGNPWTFADAGWGQGVSRRPFYVRFPATATAFASIVRTDLIAARPAAPDVDIETDLAAVQALIVGLRPGVNYEYRVNTPAAWNAFTAVGDRSTAFTFRAAVDTCYVRLAATASRAASFTTKLTDQPLFVRDVYFDNYAYGDTPVDTLVFIRNRVGNDVMITSLTLVGDSASHYTLRQSGGTGVVPPKPGTNTSWRIVPNAGLNAGSHSSARIVVAYTNRGVPHTAIAEVNLTVDRASRDLSAIRGSFDVTRTLAQQLHLNISGAPADALLSYYYGMTPVPGNPQRRADAAGNASFTFTAANGLRPASIYPVGVVVEGGSNYYPAMTVVPIAEGYTAYATPVFGNIVGINYTTEQLIFILRASAADYTFRCASCAGQPVIANPYRLTALLDSITGPDFLLSVVRNANSRPPFPASQPGYSGLLPARSAAPTVDTVVHASNAGSGGEIHIAGQRFEYRPHGGSGSWNRISGQATRLVTGDYDVRYLASPTRFTFASHARLVTVSRILNPATPIIRQCLSRDTVKVLIPPTLNRVWYQWYACDDDAGTNARPLGSATADCFYAIPDGLADGVYYYYGVVGIENSSSLTSDRVKVTVPSFSDAVFDASQPFTVTRTGDAVRFEVRIRNRGSSPLDAFYATVYRDAALQPGSPNPGALQPGQPAAGDLRITIGSFPRLAPGDNGYLELVTPDIRPYLPFTQFVVRLNDRGDGVFPYQPECDSGDSVRVCLSPFLDRMMTKAATLNGVAGDGTYANPVSILFSEEVTYRITAVNTNVRTGGVVIRDTLPPYLHVVAGSVAAAGAGGQVYTGVLAGSPPRDTLTWVVPQVAPRDTVVVTYGATLEPGVSASQPFFINSATVHLSDTLRLATNRTFHQGAGVSTVTFSASPGGTLFHAGEQALDYRTSPRTDRLLIVPDSGYAFAGWSHEAYRSLRGAVIPADSGITALDSLIVYGNVELRADFVPLEVVAPQEAPADSRPVGGQVWSYGNRLYVRAQKGTAVHVYTVGGILQRHFVIAVDGVTTLRLPRDVYFVTLNGRHDGAYKVTIRD